PRPPPRELPPPVGSRAELAEELAAFLQGDPAMEPVTLERLLAALVAFAHRDRAALGHALAPVRAPHRMASWSPPAAPASHHANVNEHGLLGWVVLAAVTPPARGRMCSGPWTPSGPAGRSACSTPGWCPGRGWPCCTACARSPAACGGRRRSCWPPRPAR